MPESMPSESLPSLSIPSTENLALETDKTGHDMANHSGHDLVNETVDIDDTPKAEKTFREKLLILLKDNALLFLTLIGVVVGFSLGFGLRQYDLSDSGLMWLGKRGCHVFPENELFVMSGITT